MLRWIVATAGVLTALLTGFGLLARYVSPDVLWPPAIVALLLPVLLLLTAGFALYQLYRRRPRAAALPVLVCLLATPVVGRLFSFGAGGAPPPPAAGAATLTIATNNVRVFKNGAWEGMDSTRIARRIRYLDADVLLLQEARHHRYANNFFGLIRRAGGYGGRHQPRDKTVATYADSLRPVRSTFDGTNGYNGYLVSDVATALGTLRIINAHLQSNRISGIAGELGRDSTLEAAGGRFRQMLTGYGRTSAIRARQAEDIRQLVEDSPHPVVVGGDFNDVPSSYTYQRIRSPRLRDAWVARGFGLGTTFAGPLPFLRIDYLLVDTALQITAVQRLDSDFSDHRPLRVTLRGR